MRKSLLVFLSAAISINFSSSLIAEEITSSEIVVTAARTAQTANEALASVTVINRGDIESSQAETLVDLLRIRSGIDILRQGGIGKQTSLFMRGANSDHTLVLIDGVRVASSTSGAFEWESLSLNQIERIEIVRGARSSLYGSEALGGVINIFTRKSKGIDAKVIVGSFGTSGVEASAGFGDKVKIHINTGYKQAEGFSAQNSSGTSYDSDNDGYRHKNISFGLSTQLSDTLKLKLNSWNSFNYSQYDKGETDSVNQTLSTVLDIAPSSTTNHRLSVNIFQNGLTTTSSNSSKIATERQSATWQSDIDLGKKSVLLVGLDGKIDRGRNIALPANTTTFDNKTINTAGFISLQKAFNKQSIEIGVRQDNHSNFGTHTTGQLAWGTQLAKAGRIFASYGTGFKAPDLNELYHPGYGGTYAGNSALNPESSVSLELGFKQNPGASQLTTSIFHTRVADLISYSGTNNQAININKAFMYGLEVGHKYRGKNWKLTSNLTLQRSLNGSTGARLLKRANEKVSIQAQRSFSNKVKLMAEVFISGGHKEFSSTIPAYGTVNLAAQKSLANNWTIEGRINNLLDRNYETSPGYNTAPRSYLIGLRYQPHKR